MRKASENSAHQSLRQQATLAGQLLVASPYLLNPSFARTVILLLQHNDEGAAGVVLNRPAGRSIQELWQQISRELPVIDRSFHLGGPLPGPMLALHRQQHLGEYQLRNDLFLAADRTHLEQLVTQPEQPFRLFVGHAGWKAGQLEEELQHGAWMLLPLGDFEVFGDEAELWNTSIRCVGRSVLELILPEERWPANVERN